ncbi:MAG: hypothetical protein AB7P04_01255 [Bacteriovoracia bacterium]
MNSNDDTDRFLREAIGEKVKASATGGPVPSPYLKTRVLARIAETERARRTSGAWRRLALATSTAAVLAVSWLSYQTLKPKPDFVANVEQVVIIRVAVEDLQHQPIAKARIELDEGVQFYSEGMPAVETQRFLQLAWNAELIGSHLPIVVTAKKSGARQVHVRFFDEAGTQLAEKTIRVQFKKG